MADADAIAIEQLERDERELVYASFDHSDAWRLGSRIAAAAIAAEHPVAIDIRRPGLILFRAALPGSTADQESWIARKAALVFRFEASSALLSARFEADARNPLDGGWLDPAVYALAGGSFPIRVRGTGVVAAATVSGLTSAQDHRLVTAAIAAELRDPVVG